MIFLNFLCWLCGAFVVGFGEYQVMRSKFGSLSTLILPSEVATALVISGTLVTCVCYLGVLGALQENRSMLITFFTLLFLLMLVELALACVLLVNNRDIDINFEKDLMRSLEVYKQSPPEGNLTIQEEFDAVQSFFKCCGVHGVTDWEGNVPVSCCVEDPCNTIPQPNWQEGCHMKLRNWFAAGFLNTGAGVVSMFIIQFICMCFSVPLFCYFIQNGLGYL